MSRRYIEYMNGVQPSRAFISQLEHELNRELHLKSQHQRALIMMLTAAASIMMIVIALLGIRPARHNTDIVSQPKALTSAPTASTTTVPTAAPTAEPTSAPTIAPTTAVPYPPEDQRLEIEMGDREVFCSLFNPSENILILEDRLIGSNLNGNGPHLIEIHQGSELNSVVIAPLRPGDTYWPINNADAIAQLVDAKGKEVGYTEQVRYYDEATNTVKEGWKHTIYEMTPPEVTEIPVPVEHVLLPGEVRADNTPLRYGKNADAPAVTILQKGQLIALAYRVGNWIYASTEPFCYGYETPFTGWIHVTEVLGASWRARPNQIDLLADGVNLRDKPDGKIIGSLNKDSQLFYSGDTVPGKNGDWHFVSVNWFDKGTQVGYISADYAKLYVFPLENELNMDGVVSATLSYSETSPFGAAEQTVEGEKLTLLLDRLRSAQSTFIYQTVCGEGTASILLKYSDGSEIILPVSGDSCTQVRHGDVTYDLKTDEERTERFLNDGGVGLSDILAPIFDKIRFN